MRAMGPEDEKQKKKGLKERKMKNERIKCVLGDITELAVDAIVNAGNERGLGGGGVDGAIHRAAGPELLEECQKLPEVRPGVRCPTGEARITKAGRLPCKAVILTVGPIWRGGTRGEPEKLANCYRNALELAAEHGMKTVAFPAISTGVYGYPAEEAAKIAIREARAFLAENEEMEVTFCLFGAGVLELYERLMV